MASGLRAHDRLRRASSLFCFHKLSLIPMTFVSLGLIDPLLQVLDMLGEHLRRY
jgi:hypothetical protein